MVKRRKVLFPVGLGLLLGASPLPALARDHADLLICNANVLTVDDAFSIGSSVAVRDERIVAVGGLDLCEAYEATRKIDLGGKTLMPGFTDTHVHPTPVAPGDIESGAARSIAELQDMLRAKARELGPGKWITGNGWDEAKFAEQRNPSRADLDAAAPANPVYLTRAGAHSGVANSAALRIAGIDRTTPDPAGGLIERDAQGEPSGIIRERNDLVRNFIPQPSWAEMRPRYIGWMRDVLALGITTVFNASGTIDDEPVGEGGIADPPPNMTFRRAREIYAEMGDCLPRMTMYISHPGEERLKAFGHRTGYGDNRLRLGPIGENLVDGGFTGPTAWLLVDYKGQPGFRGKGRFTDEELQSLVDSAAALGWQMGLHAIGDAAIVQTVNAYHRALAKTGRASSNHRWFLDHFTIMPPDATMEIMRTDNIMIAQQPNFLYNLEARYQQTLDEWRLAHNNSVATPAHKFGLFVAFGSDNLPIGPLVGLYTAITRKGQSGKVHGIEEAVSRKEAIRMYTSNGPYLSWEEGEKGTIEPGKLADMIVLPFDPLTSAPETILNGQVEMTFVGGKLVYQRP
ncbi:hydrolase [Altererythrobacter sp. B11]|uniref:amidohydrolase n=1 Tax=Altererythrobacter sp. B11 TaxID=2060312 RepID=UPI000DC71CFA|nr:amidohydrolase [Altererythrobacter sp. B11]BBC73994.1 hydrolase [Altererythrobacter sp. B11]